MNEFDGAPEVIIEDTYINYLYRRVITSRKKVSVGRGSNCFGGALVSKFSHDIRIYKKL